ncbi:MAG: DUF2085 domain-containing protein, partial [Rhodothermales bacterium]|nr:DUF2085 domain-containing protein [Rhodothermales bacterium]
QNCFVNGPRILFTRPAKPQILIVARQPLERRQVAWLILAATVVAALTAAAFLPPFLDASAGNIIMAGFSKVCHQLPDRSFHIHGEQIALCHRCVGIYAAIPPAILVYTGLRRWDSLVARHPVAVVALSLVPLAVDWGADAIGLWTNTPASRLATGAFFGIAAGYLLARGIVNAVAEGAQVANQTSTRHAAT